MDTTLTQIMQKNKRESEYSTTSLPRVVQRSPVRRPRAATRKHVQPQEIPVPPKIDKLRGAKFPVIPNVKTNLIQKEQRKAIEPLSKNQTQANKSQRLQPKKEVEKIKPRQDVLKTKPKRIEFPSKSISLYDPASKEFHPYPYITTPDAYLFSEEDDEDQKPPPPLPDEIAERIMLDNAFAKSYVDDLIATLLESVIRDIAKSFTTAQGPANKPRETSKNSSVSTTAGLPTSSNKSIKLNEKEQKAEPVYDAICEAIIMEEIKAQIGQILWNSLDEQAIFLDQNTYETILNNDRGYTVNPDLLPVFEKHAIQVGQGLSRKKKIVTDYTPFKGILTKTYMYQFHKAWLILMTSENYAERQLRLKFCNEAIWNYFYAESIKSAEQTLVETEQEEEARRTLSPYSGFETASVSSDASSPATKV